jgi:predicted PurR-regulated permease PerM
MVVAALYFAREIFIPLALAILFSFLLAPLVNRLRQWHLGRAPSVLIVVLLAFTVVGLLGELMTNQMVELTHKLPEYQQNVRKKLQSVVGGGRGIIGQGIKSVEQLRQEIVPATPPASPSQSGPEAGAKPVPVEVQNSSFSPLQLIRTVLSSLFSVMLTAFIVIVLVIFMLMEREDLRDRLVRMVGPGKLNMTTQFLDDASQRVSRYLLMQLIINVTYGIPIGLGLYFIGIPNPWLWGILTALLRYIPYAGVWIAASMPFALAVAVDPGWTKPWLVFGLYAVVEIAVANFAEPWLYGSSTGITPLAVLLSAIFWAWLWGPVGLLLSMPLTVCLASVGRYLPNFKFFNILLSDEPVLSPAARFYQRLLAMNQQDAMEVAEKFLDERSLLELYDAMVVPALVLAGQDHQCGILDEDKHNWILQNIHILVDDLSHYNDEIKRKNDGREAQPPHDHTATPMPDLGAVPPFTVCLAAGEKADEIAAMMLVQVLEQKSISAKVLAAPVVPMGKLDMVNETKAGLVCISAVLPSSLLPARQIYKRLSGEFPEIKIMVGLWGAKEEVNEFQKRFPKISPENLVTNLKQAVERNLQLFYPANVDTKQAVHAPA